MTTQQTSMRQAGLDHALFPFRRLDDDCPFRIEPPARVVLLLTVVLQRFHLDQSPAFAVPGMLNRPYPDVGNATQREVGPRDGLWRVADAIATHDVRASFVVESDSLDVIGTDSSVLRAPGHAVLAGGQHATRLHTDALAPDEERALIRDCRAAVEQATGKPVRGWRSPSCSQSSRTIDLLAEEGFEHCGDFNNDDRPYLLTAPAGRMVALPMHHFSSDLHAVFVSHQPPAAYFDGILHGIDWLARSKTASPVILSVVIHPWITGAPHRFRHFAAFLRESTAREDVVTMNADMIAETYLAAAG